MAKLRSPLDERRLDRVRTFLRERFASYRHSDYFDFEKTAQVFLIEGREGSRHSLIVPKKALDDIDFFTHSHDRLIDTLRQARELAVVWTSRGPVIEVDLSDEQRRKLYGASREAGS